MPASTCRSVALLVLLSSVSWSPAQPPEKIPSAQEVAELLQREPLTLATWTTWRARLRGWFNDRSRNTDKAFNEARALVRSQVNARGELPEPLAGDNLAWYFLGSSYLYGDPSDKSLKPDLPQAEKALRRSIAIDPDFAQAHRNLAFVLLTPVGKEAPRIAEAEREAALSKKLDPNMPRLTIDGEMALRQNRPDEAERLFREALKEHPDEPGVAAAVANAILAQKSYPGSRSAAIGQLCERFPNDASLACLHGVGLAIDNDLRGAKRAFDRSRELGVEPSQLLPPDIVTKIEDAIFRHVSNVSPHNAPAAPSVFELLAWTLVLFAAFYAVVMALMALFGVILSGRTRGKKALDLLDADEAQVLQQGQIVRYRGETLLARLYALGLFVGLILFYAAIPFVVIGLLGVTALLLYLIFMMGRIPVKLVVIVVVVGLGMAWAVFKSLFSKPASGAFGVAKSAEELPRVHALVGEVAKRVDTEPVDEIYIAPGAAIGVHQEGRGPFGIFGVKRRVLTLGLSTMHFLTLSELRSILAHEYAHFSHRDTFYSRFIYQVHLSIEQALQGMGAAGGPLNYVNPFFWFLYLYYKCYTLLSAGFSRSREFLADRMASHLYGSDVFASALTKVSTDGTLFEMTMYDSIAQLLEKQQAFVNMYDAFREHAQGAGQQREELYQKLLTEKESLFATHPTFGERIDAVASLPFASQVDSTPARELFDNPQEIEKELTLFLTDYMTYLQHLRQQAEAAAAQG